MTHDTCGTYVDCKGVCRGLGVVGHEARGVKVVTEERARVLEAARVVRLCDCDGFAIDDDLDGGGVTCAGDEREHKEAVLHQPRRLCVCV